MLHYAATLHDAQLDVPQRVIVHLADELCCSCIGLSVAEEGCLIGLSREVGRAPPMADKVIRSFFVLTIFVLTIPEPISNKDISNSYLRPLGTTY